MRKRLSSPGILGSRAFRFPSFRRPCWLGIRVGTFLCNGCVFCALPNLYPGGVHRCWLLSHNPACCGRNVPEVGPFSKTASFSPAHCRSHTARSSPAASGRTEKGQASFASVGTSPVSQKRHSAINSLRASATIITRRMRPLAPAVRSSNHLLSTLSG